MDQMVRTAERQKRRNRAWNKIGPPATYLKWFTLVAMAVSLLFFLWWTATSVLMMHKWEQIDRAPGDRQKLANELRWLFPLDEMGFKNTDAPAFVWGIGCAWFFPFAIVCGLTLAGVESARKLENYGWAMTGSCFGCLVFLPLGILCIVRLREKEVKYEFEISRMRQEGVDWEKLEDEQLAAEEEEEEDDEDEEEEEEEEERPRKRK